MTRVAHREAFNRAAIDELRGRLVTLRRALFRASGDVEAELAAIEEGLAQGEAAAQLLARLDDRKKAELEEIERALAKISAGLYGFCETCRGPIEFGHLRAVPVTRFCLECERRAKGEPVPPRGGNNVERLARAPLLPELRSLTDAEIAFRVRDRFVEEENKGLLGVRVRCRHGRVILSGEVPDPGRRRIALRIVRDELGLEAEDRLRVSRLREREAPKPPMTLGEAKRSSGAALWIGVSCQPTKSRELGRRLSRGLAPRRTAR